VTQAGDKTASGIADAVFFAQDQSVGQYRAQFRAFATRCRLILCTEDAALAEHAAGCVREELLRIEAKFSRYRDDSVTSAITRAAGDARGIVVDEETAAWLDYAEASFQQSDGLFDITSGILRRAWNFRAHVLPTPSALAALLPLIGWHKLIWQRPRLVLPAIGMELDFGGFGKEYAADIAAGICHREGIHSGVIDLGGDIHVLGPRPEGTPWCVGIADPRVPMQSHSVLELFHGGMATSGDYERYMDIDGVRYCHILNPFTGWPVQGLASVTVLAAKCLLAGTATTIAMLKGARVGQVWLENLGLPYLAVSTDGETAGTIRPTTKSLNPH
jgi:FAD:protein FMN transferase